MATPYNDELFRKVKLQGFVNQAKTVLRNPNLTMALAKRYNAQSEYKNDRMNGLRRIVYQAAKNVRM